MTDDEQLLVIGAVTDETTRGAAVQVLRSADLVTQAYADWYPRQSPVRQSAEWAPGGFLLLQARRVEAYRKLDKHWWKSVAGITAPVSGLFSWFTSGLLWVVGGFVLVLVLLVLLLRR
jgi:hypothetical protein